MLTSGVEFTTGALTLQIGLITTGVAVLIGIVIAAVAAMHDRSDPAVLLSQAGSVRAGRDRGANMFRLGLVAAQAALSLALLIACLAFVQSFRRAAGLDLGFTRQDVVVATVPLGDLGFTREQQREFYQSAWERVQSIPGVQSASLGYMTPWWNNRTERIVIPGRDSLPAAAGLGLPAFDAVTPDYLRTLGLRLLRGRWLEENDVPGSAPVVVINEALGDLYWPNESAIGRCMGIGGPDTPCRDVVGVVANHRFTGSLDGEPVPAYFLPLAQSHEYSFTPRLFVLRAGDSPLVLPLLRQVLQGLVPNLPAAELVEMEDRFEPLVAPWRLGSYTFTAMGILATMIGTLGLFTTLSYVVAERKREFAIRLAIGATGRQVAIPVVRQGILTVIIGAGFGLLLVFAASGWLQPLLFQTRLFDPLMLGGTAAVLLSIGFTASLAPARVASRRDPMDTLRED